MIEGHYSQLHTYVCWLWVFGIETLLHSPLSYILLCLSSSSAKWTRIRVYGDQPTPATQDVCFHLQLDTKTSAGCKKCYEVGEQGLEKKRIILSKRNHHPCSTIHSIHDRRSTQDMAMMYFQWHSASVLLQSCTPVEQEIGKVCFWRVKLLLKVRRSIWKVVFNLKSLPMSFLFLFPLKLEESHHMWERQNLSSYLLKSLSTVSWSVVTDEINTEAPTY